MTKTHTHSSTDSEAFMAALEQLAAVARTAVSHVGYANYAEREREAQSWIRKKHEELLASVLSRLTAAEPQRSASTGGLTSDLMNATTVSCTGLDITIACNDHDTKDAIMEVLVDARQGQGIT